MLYEVAFQASGTPRRADGNRSEPATGGQRTRNGTVDLYIAGANLDPNDVTLVGVLAAPPGMTPGQLVRFARVDIASVVQADALVDDDTRQCTMIVRFDSAQHARQFMTNANGHPFDMNRATEICYALPIVAAWGVFPDGTPPPDGHLQPHMQIPKCPMCLDKMDMSVSGLPMSLCAHTQFGMQAWESCGCVSNWPGILCRLCAIIDRSVGQTYQCANCTLQENLWVCLICCHIGCNRFHKSHAVEHFRSQGHRYSIELRHQYVWDYKGDGYIHRILHDSSSSSGLDPGMMSHHRHQEVFKRPPGSVSDDAIERAKLDSLVMYYNEMLVDQLHKQNEHFRGLVAEEELSQATVLSNWQQKLQAAKDELAELVVSEAAKQKAVAAQQKRIAKCHARVQKLDEEIKLTRDMNATLVSDQSKVKAEVASRRKERADAQIATIETLRNRLETVMLQLQ
ncbi:UBP-type domain-containing protein [Plasmodiophora brassicae]